MSLRSQFLPVSALVCLAAAFPGAQAPSGPELLRKPLVERLERTATAVDGIAGYVIVDLTSGERVERLASHVFPTASSIKVAILYELFKQAEEKRLSLDTALPWDATRAVGGSGVLFELSSPTLTLRDYATLMVVMSDNTATNVLIDRLGMAEINARMKNLGAGEIQLRRHMMDLKAAVAGRENVATPAALASLLIAIHNGQGLSDASRDAMLTILRKKKSSPMLSGIPAGIAVASKPGDLDAVRADIGIVYVPHRPYVFVAMTSWLRTDREGERAIEELSRACYEYFSRIAASSEHGRTIR